MATAQEPERVSAADFIRGFASWRLRSARRPVVVTHHGKDAHVLISHDDYRRLRKPASGEAVDALQASLANLVEAIRDAVLLFDRDRRIVALNPAARDLVAGDDDLLGRQLVDIFPGFGASLVASHVARLIKCRERFAGEVPGLLHPRQWLRVDLVPVPAGGAMILRDTSATFEGAVEGDTRAATIAAIEAQGMIGHARLSVREAIEDANSALISMVGVDALAIRRVRFSALLSIATRRCFAEALETVFRTGEPARVEAELISREGEAVPVTLSIAERRGAYASDGAVVVAVPRSPRAG